MLRVDRKSGVRKRAATIVKKIQFRPNRMVASPARAERGGTGRSGWGRGGVKELWRSSTGREKAFPR